MENHQEEFHHHKDVFRGFHARKSTMKACTVLKMQHTLDKQEERESYPTWRHLSAVTKGRRIDEDQRRIQPAIAQHLVEESHFKLVKKHLLNNFSDHIRQLGNLLNASAEPAEWVMIELKQVYWQLNRHEAACQILRMKARTEAFQCPDLDTQAAKPPRQDEITLTKAPITRIMKTTRPKIMTLDDLAKWCAMPEGELPNHIAWCFKEFAHLTDYFNHDQYFSCPNDPKCFRYNVVAIPVTSFQCDDQAVQMVCCTGSTRWRKHMPRRNHTVLLWMGTIPDCHCKSTPGCIPARLKCLFILKHAELSVYGLLAMLQTFATGPIYQTAGMWLSRRDINLRCNPHTIEATIVSLISPSEPIISSL